ncbi:unnamed protein product [Oreochromis niloticus]|nr:unnamed protein product [Mustela putorius furo]
MYRHGNFHPDKQHPSFKNRVDLQDRQMKDGDVSLILKDVTINDAGTYECRVWSEETHSLELINSTNMTVDPPGQTGGHTEDGGKDAGSVGLVIGLSIVAVVFSAAVVLILIYRKHLQCNQDSHPPPAEPQIEMSESFLNSESPAAEYNDRTELKANNCHD